MDDFKYIVNYITPNFHSITNYKKQTPKFSNTSILQTNKMSTDQKFSKKQSKSSTSQSTKSQSDIQQPKTTKTINYSTLTKIRFINLKSVVIRGIPLNLDSGTLALKKYFGQYGNIVRIQELSPRYIQDTFYVFITFDNQLSAALAMKAANHFFIGKYFLQSHYATSRYCFSVAQAKKCQKQHCTYIHTKAPFHQQTLPSFNQQQIQASILISKHIFYIIQEVLTQKQKQLILQYMESNWMFLGAADRKNEKESLGVVGECLPNIAEIVLGCLENGEISFKYFQEERIQGLFDGRFGIPRSHYLERRKECKLEMHENDIYYDIQSQSELQQNEQNKTLTNKLIEYLKKQQQTKSRLNFTTQPQKSSNKQIQMTQHLMIKSLTQK